MKQLLIIRHAKSDWGDFKLKDFDRPLNPRGHKNAPIMAQRAASKNIIPNLIVSSPALRAITTAKYFAEVWTVAAKNIALDANIYESSVSTLLDVINNFNDQFETIALFGHNPGLTDLLNYLTGEYIANMPTCGVALVAFPFDEWKLVSGGTGELKVFDYPKNEED